MRDEFWISVDCETDGPVPGPYSLLSIGAVSVDDTTKTFYREIRPDGTAFLPSALKACGLDRDRLLRDGTDPAVAMRDLSDWVETVVPSGARPVFVGWNATFDWMFTHTYLVRYCGSSPFGISGLDLKALYMGIARKRRWSDTTKRNMEKRYLSPRKHTHHALDDAIEQAGICRKLRSELSVDTR